MTKIVQTITVLSALGSTIFAAVSAWQARQSAKQTNEIAKRNKYNELDKGLDEILKISIKYPYLESKTFTKEWNIKKVSDDVRYVRYDNYCTLLFNYIYKVYITFDKDRTKVENYIDIKNWIYLHEDNWKYPIDPHENIEGYDLDFRQFINYYIN